VPSTACLRGRPTARSSPGRPVDGDERPYTSIYETVRLHTVATSVRVPPGLLGAGEVHYATVAAVAGASPGDVDVLARPFEIAGTTAVAGALSVRFRSGP
jgi:hypothetical protein